MICPKPWPMYEDDIRVWKININAVLEIGMYPNQEICELPHIMNTVFPSDVIERINCKLFQSNM